MLDVASCFKEVATEWWTEPRVWRLGPMALLTELKRLSLRPEVDVMRVCTTRGRTFGCFWACLEGIFTDFQWVFDDF